MRTGTVLQMQKKGWGYYYWPGAENLPVGEVGYVVDWRADQMTRLEWDVYIDGSDVWEVDPNPEDTPEADREPKISTTVTTKDAEGKQVVEQDLTGASMQLLERVGWNDDNIRAIDTNLFVGGAGDYIKEKDGWRVLSPIASKRKETLEAALKIVPFMHPHPADSTKPIAPIFRVVEVLGQLEWLDRQAQTQSKQRVLMNGVLATADGLEGPDGKSFWDLWNDTLSARMQDADDMSPVRLSGPLDLIKDGVNWVVPPFEYDQVIDRRALANINRLSYGLPVPPEILMGMQAQSRATAFQVEENSYRAHIEPAAKRVAQVAEDALKLILDDRDVRVVPNPSQMLARKQSVEDVKWAREQGLVDPPYTREVLGIPEDAAPEEDDGVPIGGGRPVETDPANVAADEPVTAAGSQTDLSTLLADIDAALSSELAGVTVMAVDRARTRLGAAARTVEEVRSNPEYKPLSNSQLAQRLGFDGLTAVGVKVLEVAAEPIDVAAKWWVKRIGQVWEQMSVLVPGWTGQGDWVDESVDALDVALGEHIIDSLSEPDSSPLEAGRIRTIVDRSAGQAD